MAQSSASVERETRRAAGDRPGAWPGSRTRSAAGRLSNTSGGSRLMASPSTPISTGRTGVDAKPRRRPLVPSREPADLAGGVEGDQLLGRQSALDLCGDDAEQPPVDPLAGTSAGEVRELIGVVGHQHHVSGLVGRPRRARCSAGQAARRPGRAGRAAGRLPSASWRPGTPATARSSRTGRATRCSRTRVRSRWPDRSCAPPRPRRHRGRRRRHRGRGRGRARSGSAFPPARPRAGSRGGWPRWRSSA